MRPDAAAALSAAGRFARRPGLWLFLLLVAAIFLMPSAGILFHALFPDDRHLIYSRATFLELTLAHCQLVALSSLAAAAAGIGLGVFATRESGREFAPVVRAMAAIGQTFPPVAVLALAIPALGYGAPPALAALALYAALPVLEGSITGLDGVPASARDAARGIGFSPFELLWRIELPLAAPFILAGLRTAVIINIGTATIASSAGALSLGSPILEGLSAANPAYVVEGGIIAALLAICVDRGFDWLSELLKQK
ncbi:ABC transporter permease [Methylocapsa palsarum]|uniref:Osmoprotectant transport system permease protein n=1 Tax=Methylocapsa palsarum TaxID=1612308 RepID=A0A1I3YMA6_9HYPH|nr:ABC transporter permease [Methylocapsa palsarum]SFK32903.1 osmoprotectant transport system permease protein [Methylocapsa palsarum]